MPKIAAASRNGGTVLGRSRHGLEASSPRRRGARRPALTRPLRAVLATDCTAGTRRSIPAEQEDGFCTRSLRAQSLTARADCARRGHFAHAHVRGRRLQACRESEPARDPSSSSSRGPRYVSMTSTSAAATGIGSPRLSRTKGSPPDKAGAVGAGLIDGFGAVTALACDDRRREGGPRQLGGSVLLPISSPVQGSAGVV